MKIRAKRPIRYGHEPRAVGDEFEATEAHAKVLIALGVASPVSDKAKRKYKRRDIQTTESVVMVAE